MGKLNDKIAELEKGKEEKADSLSDKKAEEALPDSQEMDEVKK